MPSFSHSPDSTATAPDTDILGKGLGVRVEQRHLPSCHAIALFFMGAIIVTSLVSRVQRSTELRTERVEMD